MNLKNWTESLARASARRRWWTLGIWVVAIVLAVFAIMNLLGDALVTDATFTTDPESMVAFNMIDERLGTDSAKGLDEEIIIRSKTLTFRDSDVTELVS